MHFFKLLSLEKSIQDEKVRFIEVNELKKIKLKVSDFHSLYLRVSPENEKEMG